MTEDIAVHNFSVPADNLGTLPSDAPEWAQTLNYNLCLVASSVAAVQETHATILKIVEELKPEVLTVVNGLQKNPMVKMLLGGK